MVKLNLPKLEHLNLSGNHLEEYPYLENASCLEYLNLNDNRLPDIFENEEDIDYKSSLKILDLGKNQLKYRDANVFAIFIYKL